MRNPELRRLYGKSLRGGLLLYGPPGCGKTFLARAVAGEMGAHFIVAGISEILDMWLGRSERNLHELFMQARRNGPCVLFLDEIDALGQKRSPPRGSAAAGRIVAASRLGVAGALVDEEDEAVADRPGADEAQRPALADPRRTGAPRPRAPRERRPAAVRRLGRAR